MHADEGSRVWALAVFNLVILLHTQIDHSAQTSVYKYQTHKSTGLIKTTAVTDKNTVFICILSADFTVWVTRLLQLAV